VDTRKLPAIYMINNTEKLKINAERLTDQLVESYRKALLAEGNQANVDFDLDDDNDEDIEADELIDAKSKDDRVKFSRLIRRFVKLIRLVNHEEANQLKNQVNAVQVHAQQMKKEQVLSHLEK
jgi:hypothetical protein